MSIRNQHNEKWMHMIAQEINKTANLSALHAYTLMAWHQGYGSTVLLYS